MLKYITKLFGTKHDRDLKKILPIVEQINEEFEKLDSLSDDELKAKTDEFRLRIDEENGEEDLDDILPEAFAVVKEACKRHVGKSWDVAGIETEWNMVPYDVQLFGGIVLHQGKISEMATGEGKTLVAVLPLYLNALSGKGVHLVTVNDYLAKRDSEWMGQILEFLGISVGCILNEMGNAERREVYNKDITYGTNNEFGFDYLRDNMAQSVEDRVHRNYNYAIVDEVDSVLIDEARTPLIISGPVKSQIHKRYGEMRPTVNNLARKQTMLVNEKIARAEKILNTAEDDDNENMYEAGQLLLSASRGAPKNKKFLKLVQEPGIKTMIGRVESDYIRDKKMHEIDETLYYVIDEKEGSINLTDNGRLQFSKEEQELFTIPDITDALSEIEGDDNITPEEKTKKIDDLYAIHTERSEKVHSISQLLRAYSLFEKDVEYVVQDGKVMIVDEFTGRILAGRRYSDGLHQAIEAKENVRIEGESQTLATITLQNYFRMYSKLAGMTGTAETESEEFWDIYKLDVVCIPTNRAVRRDDIEDVIYRSRKDKYKAIAEEVIDCYNNGRPVLVGTVSVEVSETLSRMLKRAGIKHNVLNAKHHQKEAEVVQNAGQKSAVTIATNMAGRGTDIKLGEGVVKHHNCSLVKPESEEDKCPYFNKLKCNENVSCGLHIIGTERHESRRIDRQLRGRAGRQGDPGSSKFYMSLEDDLMRLFGSDKLGRIMDTLGVGEGEVITHKMVTNAIERAQKRVELQNFSIRKHTLEYDDVMNSQREVIYDRRLAALEQESIKDEIEELIKSVIETSIETYCPEKVYVDDWDFDGLATELRNTFLLQIEYKDEEKMGLERETIYENVLKSVTEFYKQKERLYGDELMRKIEKYAVLMTIDSHWRDHMFEMDQLKTGIGLRAYGQKDPLIEYKKEAYRIFSEMIVTIDREIVAMTYKLRVREPEKSREERRKELASETKASHADSTGMGFGSGGGKVEGAGENPMAEGAKRGKAKPVVREGKKIGRNEPCPCGSGKKYKKCHGANG